MEKWRKFQKLWSDFRKDEPGQRFIHLHERLHPNEGWDARKIALIVAGLAIIAFGVFMIPVPGPGSLVILLGLGLLGGPFEPVAHGLDKFECWARGIADRFFNWWRRVPDGVRISTAVAVLSCVLAASYSVVNFFVNR